MNTEEILQLLLSEPAVFIYELLLLVTFTICIVVLSRKRKQRRQIRISAQERQVKKSLDDSLANQRRR